MTPHQFWDEDPHLIDAYIKAEQIRMKNSNYEAWLQGAYIYNAIMCLVPVLNPLSKKAEPEPYLSEPVPITKYEAELKHKQKMIENAERFRMFVNSKNEKIRKGAEMNG